MKKNLIGILVALSLLGVGFLYLGNIEKVSEEEEIKNAEDAIQKAAITCYAIEGSYAPIEYLEENYGLVLNHDKYYYHYEMIGSNVLPIIMVMRK